MSKKNRHKKVYEVIEHHPVYANEEERQEKEKECAKNLILLFYGYEQDGRLYKKAT